MVLLIVFEVLMFPFCSTTVSFLLQALFLVHPSFLSRPVDRESVLRKFVEGIK